LILEIRSGYSNFRPVHFFLP